MSFADLLDKLIKEKEQLIRENERLRIQLEDIKRSIEKETETKKTGSTLNK